MTQILEFDPDDMRRNFAEVPFAVHHRLADHPLLQLDRIAQLADSLAPSQVEANLGNVPDVLPGGVTEEIKHPPPGEIVRGIETNGYWTVLKRIESDPEYSALLDESLNEVIPLVADTEGGANRREAFLFMSAPGSTTPSHIDPEHNLLLQIQGTKDMTVGKFPDPQSEQAEIERHYSGGHRNLEAMPADATTFPMASGDGVYVPPHAPHIVKNGPQVSISFSITFYTEAVQRLGDLHSINGRLRRIGLSPAIPGQRPGSDRLKAGLWGQMRRSSRALRRRREHA